MTSVAAVPARSAADRRPVAVVGAGPVGLVAGSLLAVQGLDVVVFERHATTSDEAKAISLDGESLRSLQAAALADAVRRIVVPGTGTRYVGARGQTLFHAGAASPYQYGYAVKNQFAQPELERLLLDAAHGNPNVDVRMSTEVIGLSQAADGVAIDSRGAGGERSELFDYVLGADGGRSTVRSLLGISMSGRGHAERWLVVDVLNDEHRSRYGTHYGDPQRPHVVIAGRGGRCRYEFRMLDEECAPGRDVPFPLVRRLLAPYRDVEPHEVERSVCYTINSVVADRWRVGPVFLLGDAAHMMPPFAGQGLNSGIRDASNLCWKIGAVASGRAGEPLLGTYEQERKPHAEATIRLSERLGKIVMTTDRRRSVLRDLVVRSAMLFGPSRRYLTEMRYRPNSAITEGFVLSDRSRSIVGTALEQPQVLMADGHSTALLDCALGDGFCVLGVAVSRDDWYLAATLTSELGAQQLDVVLEDQLPESRDGRPAVSDLGGRLQLLLAPYSGQFLVVRPDRYVCAATRPEGLEAVRLGLRSLLWGDTGDRRNAAVAIEEVSSREAGLV